MLCDAPPPEPVRSVEVRPCEVSDPVYTLPTEKGPEPKGAPKHPLPLPITILWRGWVVKVRIWPPSVRVLRYF